VRAIVQRVSRAAVMVDGSSVGRIDHGLLVYLGVARDDARQDVDYIAGKIRHLRVFPDSAGKMNLDVEQAAGAVLLISNFTLLADAREGRRPEFTAAAEPESANSLYEQVRAELVRKNLRVETGRFRAMMSVEAANDGPINILLDSKRQF
jgi:D-aminoacyl-tRNA deacylase